jgi:predicted dehydrogenase
VAWDVHHFDIVLWAMGVNSPQSVFASGGNFAFADNHDYPNTFSATATFGPGPVAKRGFVMQYTMRTGGRREVRAHGKCFIGTDASMVLDRAGYSIVKEVRPGAKMSPAGLFVNAEETVPAQDDHLYHFELFLDNVRQRKMAVANPETCHYASVLGHLMNVSWEAGRSVRWDGRANRVIGDPAADALVTRPYRAPWKLEV